MVEPFTATALLSQGFMQGGNNPIGAASPLGAGSPIKAGDAAPSTALADSGRGGVVFSNPFSIAGAGGSSSATSNAADQAGIKTILIMAAIAGGALFLAGRK